MDDVSQPPAQAASPAADAPPPPRRHPVSVLDQRASDWIGVRWPHPAWFTRPLGWISLTGNYGLVWYAAALVWAWSEGGDGRLVLRRTLYVAGAVLACQGVTFFVKVIFDRRRPVEKDPSQGEHIPRPKSPSFPSSHASMSATAVVTLGVLYPASLWTFVALGALLAFSRIYLRVHYVLDVLAGLVLGTAFGVAVLLLIPPP